MSSVQVQRSRSLGRQVADVLRQRIVRGEILPGSRLVEEAVAEEFAVSRGPVRDAFTQLSFERLVEVRKPAGVFVIGLTLDDVEQLYSLRGALEALALRRAMRVEDDERWRESEASVEAMLESARRQDAEAFLAADLVFHSRIYDLAEHPRLLGAWEQYKPTFEALLDVTIHQDRDLTDAAEDHAQLLQTMRSGDEEAASAALARHLEGSHARMRAAIEAR